MDKSAGALSAKPRRAVDFCERGGRGGAATDEEMDREQYECHEDDGSEKLRVWAAAMELV